MRELDFSRITLRLKEKQDKKGDEGSDDTVAKVQGNTLDTLQRCLVCQFPLHDRRFTRFWLTFGILVQTHRASHERL